MTRASWLALGLIPGAAPATLMAQEAVVTQSATDPAATAAVSPTVKEDDAIVVNGIRERGSVEGDVTPELVLTAADIRGLGVSNVAELLDILVPPPADGAEAPQRVVLLNGKRISGFGEIQDIPSEAIQRVDILPPSVALTYGYEVDQRVTNIVLVAAFHAYTVDVTGGMATAGGRENGAASVGVQTITGDNRLNISLNANAAAMLLESERSIISIPPSPPFSIGGNIRSAAGASSEIDPALSALAGKPVTIAGVPVNAADGAPALAAFVPGANVAAVSDVGQYRSLSSESRSYSANVSWSRAFGGISTTVNGRLQRSQNLSFQGLPTASLLIPAGNPFSPFAAPVQLYRYLDQAPVLSQKGNSSSAGLAVSLRGSISPWNWTVNSSYDFSENRTRTVRGIDSSNLQAAIDAGDPAVNPFGAISATLLTPRPLDSSHGKTQTFGGDLLVNGPLLALPAGRLRLSGRIGYSNNSQLSRSVRSTILTAVDYHRETTSGQLSLDVPLTSRREGVLDAIGDLSVNANVAMQHLSDFDTLKTYGYGVRWTPIPHIRLNASASNDRRAPGGSQLNGPQIVTPNVPTFDYRTGTTVFVTRFSGSNPDLLAENRHTVRLGVTIKPWIEREWTFNSTYSRTRSDNVVSGFPSPTPAIEAAFPDRFIRDADGTLVTIDTRPTNFSRLESSQLRTGINLVILLKAPPRPAPAARGVPLALGGGRSADAGGQPAEVPGGDAVAGNSVGGRGGGLGGGGGRGGMFGGRGGNPNQGRIQISLNHSWQLTDSILIRPGLPVIDRLNGGATGGRGGQAHHRLSADFNYNNRGLGARLTGNWQSGTRVTGTAGGSDTLRFAPVATMSLRLFATFNQMPKLLTDASFLKGGRVTLAVNNLFNGYQKVTNSAGATPLQYQPDRMRGVGRIFSISLRKQF